MGVDRDEEPDSIGTSTEDVGGGIRVTEGRLRFGAHSQAQFALFWRQGSGALLEVEAFPLEHLGYGLMLRDSYGALLRERLAAFLVPPPAPAAELGPTPAVLLQHAARSLGLAYAARCMALWWYLTEGTEDSAVTVAWAGELALAAAVESVVLKRAGLSVTSPVLAERYGCSPDDVRRLMRRLHTAVGGVTGLRW